MTKRQNLNINRPLISIAIPTLNEDKHILGCLQSIFAQNYPKNRLEVIIVDAGSTDNTLKIASKYPVKVVKNVEGDTHIGKMLGIKHSTGDFYIYLDADVLLRGKRWFTEMLVPLMDDQKIVAVSSRYYSKKNFSWLTRFLTYDEIQRDPIYEFFSPSITETIVEKRKGYYLCRYTKELIPPAGMCLYRTKVLKSSFIFKRKKFMELDGLSILVSEGHNLFGYVPKTGFYHDFMPNLKTLLKKRYRNISRNYLFQEEGRYYTWFDLHSLKGFLKVITWIVYVHLFVPSLVRGIIKTLKHKDLICLVEPFLNILETYSIIFGFAYAYVSKYRRGGFR